MRASFAFLAVMAGFAPAADAGIITPGGLNAGDQFRMVFLSDGVITAADPTTASYDALVSGEAAAASLDVYGSTAVTWRAIVSTLDGTQAISRLPADSVPVYLISEGRVAASGAAFWGTNAGTYQVPINVPLEHAIDQTPTALGPVSNVYVWTGTDAFGVNGDADPLGTGPSQSFITATFGFAESTNYDWISFGAFFLKTNQEHLYAFSDVLTVPDQTAAVPEPTSLVLILSGASLLMLRPALRRSRFSAARETAIGQHSGRDSLKPVDPDRNHA